MTALKIRKHKHLFNQYNAKSNRQWWLMGQKGKTMQISDNNTYHMCIAPTALVYSFY